MSKIESIKQKMKDYFSPPKTEQEIDLEEAHLKIINLINDDPENPYLATNSVLSSMAVEHHRDIRREVAIRRVLLVLVVVFASATVILAATKKVVPYVIEINQNGQVFDINNSMKQAPSDIKKKLAVTNISDFVRSAFSVSPDGDVDNLNQSKALAFARGSASEFLKKYNETHNIKEISQKYIVSVHINYILPVSDQTFKVSWTEIKKDVKSDEVVKTNKFIGQFTYSWDNRSGNEVIDSLNPLGFYINFIVANQDDSQK